MEITSFTTQSGAAGMSAATTTGDTGVINSDFETFLVMLTAQLQNQDPLNPMDSSDYAVQLATFSGVEQQVLTNELLRGLGAEGRIDNLASVAGWVGWRPARKGPPISRARPWISMLMCRSERIGPNWSFAPTVGRKSQRWPWRRGHPQ